MKKNNIVLGSLYIAIGACSYGVLSTIVKYAYEDGYTTPEVVFTQILLGFLGCLLIVILKGEFAQLLKNRKDIKSLMIMGTSTCTTSIFYYTTVQFIDASIAVVLLMQSVWIGVVVESVINKRFPSIIKIIAAMMVIFGTLLATNVLSDGNIKLNFLGLFFGILSALSFSLFVFVSNKSNYQTKSVYVKSTYMLAGGLVLSILFFIFFQILPNNFSAFKELYSGVDFLSKWHKDFDYSLLYKWALPLSILGMVVPPLFFNKGFPITGIARGCVISSLELPTAVLASYIFLGEEINIEKILGMAIILSEIVLMNIKFSKG